MRSYAPDDEDNGTVQRASVGTPRGEEDRWGSLSGMGMEELSWGEDNKRLDVKRGPFSKQEKNNVWEAIVEYEAENNKSREEIVDAFSEYGSRRSSHLRMAVVRAAQKFLPHRTKYALFSFVRRMLRPVKRNVPFTKDEDEVLRTHVAKKGTEDWVTIADHLNRLPTSCRDRWRQMGHGHDADLKRGRWDEEEEQQLVKLVREYLATKKSLEAADKRAQIDEEKEAEELAAQREGRGEQEGSHKKRRKALVRAVGGRNVLDDIDWDLIAQQMGYKRNGEQCRHKWYDQLSSSMVDRGDWGVGDDKRMLLALRDGGYEVEWEVPWGSLVEGRSEQAVKRRWLLMLKAVSGYRDMEFVEIVDYLVDRFINKRQEKEQHEQEKGEQIQQQQQQQQQQEEQDGRDRVNKRKKERSSVEEGQQEQPSPDQRDGDKQHQQHQQQQQQQELILAERKQAKQQRKEQARQREVEKEEVQKQEVQGAATEVSKEVRKKAKHLQRERHQEQQLQQQEVEGVLPPNQKLSKEERRKKRKEQQREDQQQQQQQQQQQEAKEVRKKAKHLQRERHQEQQLQQQEVEGVLPPNQKLSKEERRKKRKEQQREDQQQQQQQQQQQEAEQQPAQPPLVQYIILRKDLWTALKWPLGSIVAQACHASTAALHMGLKAADAHTATYCSDANIDSMHKVVLEIKDEKQLRDLSAKLSGEGIQHKLWVEQPEDFATSLATKPYPKTDVANILKSCNYAKQALHDIYVAASSMTAGLVTSLLQMV
eukprot:CAMPEP_0202420466 /NCGR_PEP_ID=MMETSP1128-20130828/49818_1 /ASSEMBLY_ACC=CAM_ASM_000463 /TAXON_ID=3047 /ORGANISM="Dunaliella tertiolecta, Strain CCMP1320" /LENGTH=762 /DNA_ID=CAMNT_0049028449 /DNA_START=42 /DNA_END=2331 /DNA_ORIENTATION=-